MQEGYIGPGTTGAFELVLDATGSDVSLEYDINLNVDYSNNEVFPKNLIFYTDSTMQNAIYHTDNNINLNGFIGWNGKNKFTGLVKNISINSTTGIEGSSTRNASSDFIQVDFTNNNYYLSGLSSDLRNFVAFYNENKEFMGRTGGIRTNFRYLKEISAITLENTGVGGNITYIRITQYELEGFTEGTIDQIENLAIQLEVGDEGTTYEPYLVTSSTTVKQNRNHTLTAIWEPVSNTP